MQIQENDSYTMKAEVSAIKLVEENKKKNFHYLKNRFLFLVLEKYLEKKKLFKAKKGRLK